MHLKRSAKKIPPTTKGVVCLKGGTPKGTSCLWGRRRRNEQYDDIHTTKEERHLIDLIAENRERLEKTLTEQQKEQLEKYIDCFQELSDLTQKEVFLHGFRLKQIVHDLLMNKLEENRTKKKGKTYLS